MEKRLAGAPAALNRLLRTGLVAFILTTGRSNMWTRYLLIPMLFAVAVAGCHDTGIEPQTNEVEAAPLLLRVPVGSPNVEAALAQLERDFLRTTARADLVVRPGESIQAAVDRAQPGAVIHIMPDTYAQSVTINKPNLKLIGLRGGNGEGVVLVNPGGATNGINVQADGDGVVIAELTTRGYVGNGVFMVGVQGFLIRRVVAEDNGLYGIYPVRSSDGVMMNCTASGHADAGLYIGQSERVVMFNNVAYGNVIGIEISNSTDIVARGNDAYNNTIGILAVLLPPSPRRTILVASDFQIVNNRVWDNNLPNFAPPTELPAYVPSGSGILVVGADRTLVEGNRVTGNNWVGIGVGSTATFIQLAGLPPEAIAGLEPDPDHVVVRRNYVVGNGMNPPPPPFPLPGVDLLWDGTGTNNCWERNIYNTSFPPVLPPCS
jgi:parallel beta-helix repeat protein